MTLKIERLLSVLPQIAMCAVPLLVIVWELTNPPHVVGDAGVIDTGSVPSGTRGEISLSAFSGASDITERPLFRASRRAPSPPPAPTPAPVTEPPPASLAQYVLIGTMADDTGRRAIVKSPKSAKPVTVREGQLLDGWTVTRIVPGSVALAAGTAQGVIQYQKGSRAR